MRACHHLPLKSLRTNPSKAETLIPQYPEHEQHTIVFTATQTATRTTWNTEPQASQIRALATHMRQRFDEPIDAYAIATTINLVFNPTSTQLQHRYDAIDFHTKRRMAFLIPSALHSFTQPTPTETETWVKTTITEYEQSIQMLNEHLGPDLGGFYRIICTAPQAAIPSGRLRMRELSGCSGLHGLTQGVCSSRGTHRYRFSSHWPAPIRIAPWRSWLRGSTHGHAAS